MDEGCLKFHQRGLDVNQRRQIADLISRYFRTQGFPGHNRMDTELANQIADGLPALVCEELTRETS